jgi:hypothetical protein
MKIIKLLEKKRKNLHDIWKSPLNIPTKHKQNSKTLINQNKLKFKFMHQWTLSTEWKTTYGMTDNICKAYIWIKD